MSEKIKQLKGAKGGGGGGSVTTTVDNLRARDTVEAVLALCEGPINGLENGRKSFYVGDTPLENQDGTQNFKTIKLDVLSGVPDPDPIKFALGGTSSNTSVGITLSKDTSVVRQTSTGNIDFIEVRLLVQRLMKSNSSGTFTNTVNFRIEYKAASSSTWIKLFGKDLKLSGKTTSPYPREYRIQVDRIEEPYDIRVTKLSENSTDQVFTDIAWESFQEVFVEDQSYPNTAIAHIVGEGTDQFSSIPTWSGIYETRLVKVPVNYNPVTREYSGIWEGDWKVAYTNNPAWCLYDFITNEDFGMASYYKNVTMDKYDVYEAAQWCDEMVPDGQGGLQPRYTLNISVTKATPGKELARYIAGVFNSSVFDDLNGTVFLKVDKDEPAVFLFTQENVYDGQFIYSFTDVDSRYNDISVKFVNKDLNWEEDRRRIYDQELIDKHGRIPLDFVAVGCLDPHEARRRAYYKLITANTETKIVNFSTNRLAQMVQPFDVILIADPDQGYGLSGRIKSLNEARDVVTLRDSVYLEAGVSYNFSLMLEDGTFFETSVIKGSLGSTYTLELSDALPETGVPEKSVFYLSNAEYIGLPRPFRVLSITEQEGDPDRYNIEAININRNKWEAADNLLDFEDINYSVLPSPYNPPGPQDVSFLETFVREFKEFHLVISATFDRSQYKYYSNEQSIEVWSRPSGTTEAFVKRELKNGDTVINHPPGEYEFKVLGRSYLGQSTDIELSDSYYFEVTNPVDPPAPVDWIRINTREVYWGYENPPLDFAGFILRYHNQVGRTTWQDGAQPHQGVLSGTSFYTNLIPPSARTIMVRPVDVFGIVSETSGIIYRQLGDLSLFNVLERFDYHLMSPPFQGTVVGGSVESGELRATDTGGQMYSGVPTSLIYSGTGTAPLYSETYPDLLYYGDFSTLYRGELTASIDFDGAGYEVSIREEGETSWEPLPDRLDLLPGDYEFRLKVFGGKQRGIIREFSLIVDIPDELEEVQDLIISSGGTRVPLTKNFSTIKLVNVIIQDDGVSTAAVPKIVDKDADLGPLVKLFDLSGNPVSGTVDVQVRGYFADDNL